MSTLNLFFGKFNEVGKMPSVALLQQRVLQHLAKRRSQSQRDRRGHAIALPAFEHLQQGQVALRNGFEQPAFFEELFVLRMAHERQMSVEDEREVARHSFCSVRRENFKVAWRKSPCSDMAASASS